jgi:pimeloyl-ACP methyl ester carboxylesterase
MSFRTLMVRGTDQTSLSVLPGGVATRSINAVFPEPDGVLMAAKWHADRGSLNDDEAPQFTSILKQAYMRTEPRASSVPTPAIATYLGMESPASFDSFVIEARAQGGGETSPLPGKGALIFLHGYAGNFYVYCWEAAQAAARAHLLTVCPSTSSEAAWWSDGGNQILRSTIAYLRGRGVERIYLAGLSNGAAGASALALRNTKDLAGLILISGVRASQPPGLPTLVIQGARDRMMPAASARTYAAKSPTAKYQELPGGHLIFLSQQQQVRGLIAAFLRAREQLP